ncbi:hypothetical protein [Streptomyces sp. NPDC057257]|uniref:hypothetical protein n=1 Tax=Streptomyces sp. NPDC057257 TaxID=3346071 RepID=UPI00363B346D
MSTFTATEPEPTTPEQRATAADRAWFEHHPQATDYRRPTVPGEFGPGLYFDGGRTHVTRLLAGVTYRVGQFAAFEDPNALRIARTPQWRPWAPEGAEIPPEIAAADALYRTPEALAVLALLEAEDTIKNEGEAA